MEKRAINVAKALARLSEVTIFELRGEWRRLHRMPPPMRLSRARQKSLLDAGIIRRGRWASIVFPLPEADGAFVDCEHWSEVSLCHAGKSPRRAQLPTSDEIDTPIGHGRLVIFHVRR
jgi:hypothetical protein